MKTDTIKLYINGTLIINLSIYGLYVPRRKQLNWIAIKEKKNGYEKSKLKFTAQ